MTDHCSLKASATVSKLLSVSNSNSFSWLDPESRWGLDVEGLLVSEAIVLGVAREVEVRIVRATRLVLPLALLR